MMARSVPWHAVALFRRTVLQHQRDLIAIHSVRGFGQMPQSGCYVNFDSGLGAAVPRRRVEILVGVRDSAGQRLYYLIDTSVGTKLMVVGGFERCIVP